MGTMDQYALALACEAHAALQDGTDMASPALSSLDILELVVASLPKQSLIQASLVSQMFRLACQNELLRHVELDTVPGMTAFMELLRGTALGRRVRGFVVTKATLMFLAELPPLTPFLTNLTITSSTSLTQSAILNLYRQWPRFRHLTLIGQDHRLRRRPSNDAAQDTEVGRALRTIADGGVRLTSLRIQASKFELSSLEYFLERCGESVEELEVSGCSVGADLTRSVAQFCPRLKECRLDLQSTRRTPPSSRAPPNSYALEKTTPFVSSNCLRNLHLSSMPEVDPAIFAVFSDTRQSSLKSLSLSNCRLSAQHLSHFTRIVRLRLVDCPAFDYIPVFPTIDPNQRMGAGCKELRHISILGCRGLSLLNLWELVMLGHEHLRPDIKQEREALGLGQRGVKKLIVDGAGGRCSVVAFGGVIVTLPPSVGRPCGRPISALPEQLLPPAHLNPYLSTNVLSPMLPTVALLQTLLASKDLEECAFFGTKGDNTPAPPVQENISRWQYTWQCCLHAIRAVASFVPIVGYRLPPPHDASGLHTPPVRLKAHDSSVMIWPPSSSYNSPKDCGKRLTDDEVVWLLANHGSLRRVLV